jgi:hypothetical protein
MMSNKKKSNLFIFTGFLFLVFGYTADNSELIPSVIKYLSGLFFIIYGIILKIKNYERKD